MVAAGTTNAPGTRARRRIFWTWSDGGHTTTSSEGLWDQPMDRSNTDFSFTFPDAGFYSFYCAFHPAMMGFIDVQPNVGVQPDPANTSTIGFIADPYPNPTQTGVTLRFAMRREGRARVGVYDASGRRLAQTAAVCGLAALLVDIYLY